ncbi:MAG: hypothetical protein IIC30_04180, partial [Chloroflexi bacterium]|nr:hypothetical protein [Chloroflexota bacterium]
ADACEERTRSVALSWVGYASGWRCDLNAIAEAARILNEERENWLNPSPDPDTGDIMTGVDLKKRTLTNLYNAQPSWLQFAHERLDAAVLDAYGWPSDITDEEILERLLELNFEREPV